MVLGHSRTIWLEFKGDISPLNYLARLLFDLMGKENATLCFPLALKCGLCVVINFNHEKKQSSPKFIIILLMILENVVLKLRGVIESIVWILYNPS